MANRYDTVSPISLRDVEIYRPNIDQMYKYLAPFDQKVGALKMASQETGDFLEQDSVIANAVREDYENKLSQSFKEFNERGPKAGIAAMSKIQSDLRGEFQQNGRYKRLNDRFQAKQELFSRIDKQMVNHPNRARKYKMLLDKKIDTMDITKTGDQLPAANVPDKVYTEEETTDHLLKILKQVQMDEWNEIKYGSLDAFTKAIFTKEVGEISANKILASFANAYGQDRKMSDQFVYELDNMDVETGDFYKDENGDTIHLDNQFELLLRDENGELLTRNGTYVPNLGTTGGRIMAGLANAGRKSVIKNKVQTYENYGARLSAKGKQERQLMLEMTLNPVTTENKFRGLYGKDISKKLGLNRWIEDPRMYPVTGRPLADGGMRGLGEKLEKINPEDIMKDLEENLPKIQDHKQRVHAEIYREKLAEYINSNPDIKNQDLTHVNYHNILKNVEGMYNKEIHLMGQVTQEIMGSPMHPSSRANNLGRVKDAMNAGGQTLIPIDGGKAITSDEYLKEAAKMGLTAAEALSKVSYVGSIPGGDDVINIAGEDYRSSIFSGKKSGVRRYRLVNNFNRSQTEEAVQDFMSLANDPSANGSYVKGTLISNRGVDLGLLATAGRNPAQEGHVYKGVVLAAAGQLFDKAPLTDEEFNSLPEDQRILAASNAKQMMSGGKYGWEARPQFYSYYDPNTGERVGKQRMIIMPKGGDLSEAIPTNIIPSEHVRADGLNQQAYKRNFKVTK